MQSKKERKIRHFHLKAIMNGKGRGSFSWGKKKPKNKSKKLSVQ